MARADLLKRLDDVETALGRPVVLGMWAHENGRPTYHHLAAKGLDLARWFETGELPQKVQFVAVMHCEESERLYVPEGRDQFVPSEAELHEGWEPFPTLHLNALKHFQKMLELPFYNFHGGQLNGMNGPLNPDEQRTELYPHG